MKPILTVKHENLQLTNIVRNIWCRMLNNIGVINVNNRGHCVWTFDYTLKCKCCQAWTISAYWVTHYMSYLSVSLFTIPSAFVTTLLSFKYYMVSRMCACEYTVNVPHVCLVWLSSLCPYFSRDLWLIVYVSVTLWPHTCILIPNLYHSIWQCACLFVCFSLFTCP